MNNKWWILTTGVILLLTIKLVAATMVVTTCNYNVTVNDICCDTANDTYGWWWNGSGWEYISRPSSVINLTIKPYADGEPFNELAFCANITVNMSVNDSFNANLIRLEDSCKNNSIAYLLNHWEFNCSDAFCNGNIDEVALQSAIWYFWYMNESACLNNTTASDLQAKRSNQSQGGSDWIPNCTANSNACYVINESINKSVPKDITLSGENGIVGESVTIIANVTNCTEPLYPTGITVVFEVNDTTNCSITLLNNTTVNGTAIATLSCSKPGFYKVTARIYGWKWPVLVDPRGCNDGMYQETIILQNITNQTVIRFDPPPTTPTPTTPTPTTPPPTPPKVPVETPSGLLTLVGLIVVVGIALLLKRY